MPVEMLPCRVCGNLVEAGVPCPVDGNITPEPAVTEIAEPVVAPVEPEVAPVAPVEPEVVPVVETVDAPATE